MYATKNGITKTIQKQDRYLYESMGFTITRDINEPYDPYDYNDVSANRLEAITINGEVFEGYSSFTCINTKTYVEEPARTLDGSIPNINDYDTFVVPRVKVSFAYMTINDFRRFLRAITPNEFPVTYYDYELDKMVTHNMYCETREMSNIFNKGYEILAITGETISLIGTLNDMDYVSIKYYDNTSYVDETTGLTKYYLLDQQQVINGNTYAIVSGNGLTHSGGESGYDYTLTSWNTQPNGKGVSYISSQVAYGTADLELYAQWSASLHLYNVTYNMNGGTNSPLNPQTFTINSDDITLNPPSRDGYNFVGWYSDSAYSTLIETISKGTTNDITLYAKWEEQ